MLDGSTDRSLDRSISRYLEHSIDQSLNLPIPGSLDKPVDPLVHSSLARPTNPSAGRLRAQSSERISQVVHPRGLVARPHVITFKNMEQRQSKHFLLHRRAQKSNTSTHVHTASYVSHLECHWPRNTVHACIKVISLLLKKRNDCFVLGSNAQLESHPIHI